jgi:CheY-like chemotaxis protein
MAMQLMVRKAPEPPPGDKRGGEMRGTGEAARIVIVEDELMVAWSLEATVEDFGYSVVGIFADGAAALAALAREPTDLVLMDINLGRGMDGVDTARRIKAAHSIPVIFISAYADPETQGRIADRIPGSVLLSKPVQPAILEAAMRAALNPPH